MSLPDTVDRFLDHHLGARPVDATFMGFDGHDHELPKADEEAVAQELEELRSLEAEARSLPRGTTAAERLEHSLLSSQVAVAKRELEVRPRHHNPSWYIGEAAFGIVSLLLPREGERDPDALRQRLEVIPRFLRAGERRLAERHVTPDWSTRAKREGEALIRLLERGGPRHPDWTEALTPAATAAGTAVRAFLTSLDRPGLPSSATDAGADRGRTQGPAAGEAYLAFLMREAHHLPFSPAEAEELALEGFETARTELLSIASELDPAKSWREQLEALDLDHPSLDAVLPTYERLHQRAMEMADAAGLVTPAADYGLRFEPLEDWAHEVAGDLYFLFYRSPPARRSGTGSVYWVFPPGPDLEAYLRGQSRSTIKITHAVHHGSIGHHTQNARARDADVRLGRVAGTDCATGIAMLPGGTMIEGWACYTQDLLLEAEGFYRPAERLLLKHAELRNAAMCLADVRLHRGVWGLDQMRAFYTDEVGIPKARAWSESTRNSMFPSSRLMYWLGTRAIKELRVDIGGDARAFHDALLSYGSVPVYDVATEMREGAPAARGGKTASGDSVT